MDLAIRGATVITDGAYARDILIRDGRVSALVEPGASTADEEIDARGLFALPGIVDAHVHFNEPGRELWEGWRHGSRAAAAGGVTTVIDMPLNSLPPVIDGAAFDLKRAAGERGSIVDFALWGGLVGTDPVPLLELAARGAVGVKAFLCDSGVPEFPAIADDSLIDTMRAATSAGLLVAVHAEDEEIIHGATTNLRAQRHDPGAWVLSRPPSAEIHAVARACAVAQVTGTKLHVVHLSTAEAVDVIAAARNSGVDVTVETCAHYLTFDEADVLVHGPLLKCAPPIRDAANRDALWKALLGSRIDLVASDHSPCPAADKVRGNEDIFAAWGGIAGVQSLLPAVLTGARARGRGMDARKIAGFVAWRLAAKPAERFGLAARKGRIRPGADADIVLIDPERRWTLEHSDVQTRSGLTPYTGRTFTGAVVRTIVRGVTVYLDGEFPAAPGHGRFIPAERAA